MRKIVSIFTVIFASSLLFASLASAHVVVYPKEATQGSYEKFTVRVPTEKEVPTVKVEVEIPQEVNISRFLPIAGWAYEIAKDETDKITKVTWTAEGAGLSSTEFGEFSMQGKIADDAEEITWKAIQTYKDGSIAEWTGGSDADTPASVTKVNPKVTDGGTDANTNSATSSDVSESTTLLYVISIAALILALIAVILAARKRK